jgi:1-deoxy-D-xylulose-5-phosphate reductoisomerase
MSAALYPFLRPRALPEPLRLCILGATGSIGTQTLDLLRRHPERLQLVAVSVNRRWQELADLLPGFSGKVAIEDPAARDAAARSGRLGSGLLPDTGAAGLVEAIDCDVVVNGIVGAAGLAPSLAAVRRGRRLALANKESLVVGGDLIREALAGSGAEILPVDSEHSAVAQCLCGRRREDLARVILTASGGPFREFSPERLRTVTRDEVLAHPTWQMGPKITVDSATLMNKGLEVIEAHHLFGLDDDAIDVVVHPGSWVHSFVQLRDGALLAQLGAPDMRVPLLYAITGEQRWPLATEVFDLLRIGSLHFEAPDTERFPCLDLARQAGRQGGTAPITLNAANEVAVAALLADDLAYHEVSGLIAAALDRLPVQPVATLDDALAADHEARRVAAELLARRGRSSTLRGQR